MTHLRRVASASAYLLVEPGSSMSVHTRAPVRESRDVSQRWDSDKHLIVVISLLARESRVWGMGQIWDQKFASTFHTLVGDGAWDLAIRPPPPDPRDLRRGPTVALSSPSEGALGCPSAEPRGRVPGRGGAGPESLR
jgi:hypothetical protein